MLEGIGLIRGIMAKMDWLDQNQRVIAENVANSDTPGFQPMALSEPDFKSLLGPLDGGGSASVALEATNPAHFGAGGMPAALKMGKQKVTYEASPDNNGVVLEEQLFKASENNTNYQIATNLYRRNVGMLRMVIQGVRG